MPFISLLLLLLSLYKLVVIVYIIMSWLIQFSVINTSHPLVQGIWGFTSALTEPVLKHLRGIAKPINGIDLSALILIIGIWFTEYCINYYLIPAIL